MNDRVRIADLPSSSNVDKDSYMLVERPGIGMGTFKTTLGDIQEAITVRAKVEQVDKVTTITVKDITGEYTAQIVTPTAKVVDNGDNTYTITITDTEGTTETSAVSRVIFDPWPIEGSCNLVTSGTVWTIVKAQEDESDRITQVEGDMADTINQMNQLLDDFAALQQHVADEIASADQRIEATEETVARSLVVEDNQEIDYPYSIGKGVRVNSLQEAIIESHIRGTAIKLFSNARSYGVIVPEGNNFTLDLNGYKLTIEGSGAGAFDNQSNGIQILKNTVGTIKNGTIEFIGDYIPDPVQLLDEDSKPIQTEYEEDIIADGIPADLSPLPLTLENGQDLLTQDYEQIMADGSFGEDEPLKPMTMPLLDEEERELLTESGDLLLAEEMFNEIVYIPMFTEDDVELLTEDGLQLLADEFLRGNITIGIDNYSDLTLDNVQLFGNRNVECIVANNYGNTVFQNHTSIMSEGSVAFRAIYGNEPEYDSPGVFVTVADDSVDVMGSIQFGKADRATYYNFKMNAGITVPEDMSLDTEVLTIPCDWVDNGDGTKTLKYTGLGA